MNVFIWDPSDRRFTAAIRVNPIAHLVCIWSDMKVPKAESTPGDI